MSKEIQEVIDKKLEQSVFDTRLAEFKAEIINGDGLGGLAKIDDLVELANISALNPSYTNGHLDSYAENATIAAGHLKNFLGIMAENDIKPDSRYSWESKEQRTGLFSKKKYTVKREKTVPTWQIQYSSNDGYPQIFHITQDGRISVNVYSTGDNGWIPSEYTGMGILLGSLADKMIAAGVTELE